MTYEETLHYLYTSIPVFQHSGGSAYKPGLGTSKALDDHLKNPHEAYKIIHVGGTNGKGSTSHLIAAILQKSGFKVGLFTSPHLVDFRERIKVNGEMIPKDYVISFVEKYRPVFEPLQPSFFELTSSMAFDYFRSQQVDYAVVEVGLGGRLDSTNIITPILSVITNISKDHTQFLGNTLEAIASEKAGIIKPNVPVVIGDVEEESVMNVFLKKAREENAPLYASTQIKPIKECSLSDKDYLWHYQTRFFGEVTGELGGIVQSHNAATVLTAVSVLQQLQIPITSEAIKDAFANVVELTGLMGRWQTVHSSPRIVCDTGHNIGGWEHIARQLDIVSKQYKKIRIIVGMVNDKDINGVLALMPKNAIYYFTQASVNRALPAEDFASQAAKHGLQGRTFPSVTEAIQVAQNEAAEDDFIFIGGSTFIVADAYPLFLS